MPKDSQLQQAVLAELSWEPSVIAAHIGVTAKSGIVTLTGHVSNFAEKHAAATAAQRVKGVTGVAVDIEVRLAILHKRGDDDIAAAAVERLRWDVLVPKDCVKVSVERGWVTLSGQVDWHYQRDAAEQDIVRLSGVVGLSDHITIKERPDSATLSDSITHALGRSWLFDGDSVTVRSSGGTVTLSGTVRSPHDRDLAATTAWAAAGTIAVDNELTVS